MLICKWYIQEEAWKETIIVFFMSLSLKDFFCMKIKKNTRKVWRLKKKTYLCNRIRERMNDEIT